MIRNKDILKCLPLLASALGDRYGVKVRMGGTRAYTNGNVIQLPALPTDCGQTAIALAKGYIDHEAAHIRHTDFTSIRRAYMDAATKHLCNSIEDWRVEKCLSELYPGCRNNLDWLARHIFLEEDSEEAGNKDPASSVLNYVLLSVRAWNVEEINDLRIKTRLVVDQAYPGLSDSIDDVLVRVRATCGDTQASINYASEIARLIKGYTPSENHPSTQNPSTNAQSSVDSETSQNDCVQQEDSSGNEEMADDANSAQQQSSDSDGESNGGDTDNQKGDLQDSAHTQEDQCKSEPDFGNGGQTKELNSPAETGEEKEENDNDNLTRLKSLFDKDEDELPKNLGEIIADMLAGDSCEKRDDGFTVASCVKHETGRLDDEEREAALQSSNAMRQRLAGLLQAQEIKRISPGKRGKLNPVNLHRLSVGNPRIFKKEDMKTGQNSAIHILLDASYSMEHEPIKLARQACYAIAVALSNIRGVNPAVTVFPAGVFGNVYPLLQHNQKLTDRFHVEADGGTPLASALWWVAQTLYPMREERKIVLVITDGVPDNTPAAQDAIRMMGKLGMEIYGIGINMQVIEELLPGKCRVIHSLQELAPAMFGMLQDTLIRGGSHDSAH